MKQYKYMLFDWDGTIVRTLDIWHDSLKVSLEKHGYFLSDKEIGANFEHMAQRLKNMGQRDPEPIIQEAAALSETNLPHIKAYKNSFKVLRKLKKSGKKLAIVTTSLHRQVDPLLVSFNVENLFDAVVCSDDVRNNKPDPEPIVAAMKQMNASPENCVMIGDSEKDIECASRVGIDSILFYPAEHNKFYTLEELYKLAPTATIGDLAELLQSP